MRGSFIFFVAVFVGTVTVFGGLVIHSLQSLDPPEVPETVRLGKQVWQEKVCVECHTVLGHGGYFGPDLTDVWARLGTDGLAQHFRVPPVLPTAQHKKHLSLVEEEAELVIKYLEFLGGINRTGSWPPQPLFPVPEGR